MSAVLPAAPKSLRDAWAAPIQIPGEAVLPRPADRTPERADDRMLAEGLEPR